MEQSSFRKRENIDRYTFEKMGCFLDSSKDAPLPVLWKRAGRYLSSYSKVRESFFFEYLFCSCEVDVCCFCVLDFVVTCYLVFSQISHCRGRCDRIIMLV